MRYQFWHKIISWFSNISHLFFQLNILTGTTKASVVRTFWVWTPLRSPNSGFLSPKWYDKHLCPFYRGVAPWGWIIICLFLSLSLRMCLCQLYTFSRLLFHYLSLWFVPSVLLSEFTKFADEEPVLEFAQVPFNFPLYIMYSSGTTGPPKCMVHSVGVSQKIANK